MTKRNAQLTQNQPTPCVKWLWTSVRYAAGGFMAGVPAS